MKRSRLPTRKKISIIGESKYRLNYKFGNQTLSDTEKIEVTIKDRAGNKVNEENSKYTFVWGETYTYEISPKNGIMGTQDSFTPVKGQTSVDIPVTLTLPVFRLEGKDLSQAATRVKSGEDNIPIACDNVSSLYDPAHWSIQINHGEKKAVGSTDIKFDTNENVTITYYYDNEQAASYNVTRFSSYKVHYYYDGAAVTPDRALFNGDLTVNEWKANNTYTLESMEEQGLGFTPPDPDAYKVETKYTEESYDIHLQSKDVQVAAPQIYILNKMPNAAGEYEFIFGERIEVRLEHASSYLNGGEDGWQWSCKNGNRSLSGVSGKTGDILTYTLDLTGETEGIYTLKYVFGNGQAGSNELPIRIKKLKVYASKLPPISKFYDGNNEFEYKLKLSGGYFKDQDGNQIDYDNDIILKCAVGGSNVGKYDTIQINGAVIEDNGAINHSAFDLSDLENKKGGYSVDKAEIKKADVKLRISNLHLYYMDETGDPNNSIFSEEGSNIYKPIDTSLKQVVFDYLGKAINVDEVNMRCSFDANRLSFDDKNLKCNIILSDSGLGFQYSPQKLDISKSMQNKIDLRQQKLGSLVTVNTENKWINKSALQAEFNESGSTQYGKYYNKITFTKLTCENGIVSIPDTSEVAFQDNDLPIKPQQENEDTYYGIILSKNGQYKTIALILRIVAEQNKDNTYPTEIEGDNGITYSAVNLYLDASKDNVVFEETLGGADIEGLNYGDLTKKKDYKENGESISFEIQNSISDIQKVRYGFVEFTGEKPDSSRIEWKQVKEDAQQSVPLDLKDGNYVMYVEVTDEAGNQSTYVTNGFVVDNKPPELHFLLNQKEISGEELDERIYKKEEQEVTIRVTEENIKNVEVNISAVNRKNESALPEEVLRQMEADMVNDIKENNTYTFKPVTDANYTIHVKVEDANDKYDEDEYLFTIDRQAPEMGEVKIKGFFNEIVKNDDKEKGIIKTRKTEFEKTWNSFVERIYEIFAKDSVTVTLSAQDSMSDVEIYYLMTDREYTEDRLKEMEESTWTAYDPDHIPKTKVNQREFVYMKAVDWAGNASYFNSKGIITDTVAPAIDAKLSKDPNASQFYNGDVTIHVNISELTNSTQAGASGLQYAGYRVECEGKVTESKAVIDKPTSETEKSFDIRLSAEKHNKNDIKVYITAVDNAGNKNEGEPISLNIDSTKPEINVTYKDEEGGRYYNHARTATITIKERNLDTKDIAINIKSEHGSKAAIGKWSHTDNIGPSDDAVYTCQITFDADDDYEFSVDCVDKAGNRADKVSADKFTVDKTIPKINVSYSNNRMEENGYYNEAVTATVTLEEHNFDAGKTGIRIKSEDGEVSSLNFKSSGDMHTASVVFDHDGTYSLQVTCVDEAGNEAETYHGNIFNIDVKSPEIEIHNVKDKSANKDDIKPVIICTDENYDKNQVSLTVRGSNSGETDLKKLNFESRSVANGEEFSLTFPKEEIMDDVYTLAVKMVDKAGNETEDSIQFSVNRYGSVYTLGTETGEWLTNGVCSYIREGRPVVIIETNIDEVEERNIVYTTGAINAEKIDVKELAVCSSEEKSNRSYYETKEISRGDDWYQYQYTIEKQNFTKEGKYSIQIDSVDKAGNHTSNVSNRHSRSELEILFAIDQTAPSAVVTGTENGGNYRQSSRTVLLDVQDNLALNTVSVYLNGEEYASYDAREISKLKDGLIPVVVENAMSTQTIQLKATDMAGNVLGKDTDGKYDAMFEDFHLLVTNNVLVQMMHSFWIFVVLAFVVAGVVIAVVFVKHKSKEKR